MSEEKIGMYTAEEIYDELANGFLHRSMVDAMYFQIKDLQQKVEQLEKELQTTANNCKQLENIKKEVIEYIKDNACYSEGHCKCSFSQIALDNLLNILNKGENNE